MIKIVLITTGQPSTNPRIVKEADALLAAGLDVTVLYCHFINWATEADINLLKNEAWKHQISGGSPFQNRGLYIFTRLRFRLSRLMNQYFGNKMLVAERAQARAYDELLKAAKTIKADWYIGHNLGALPIAVKAAEDNDGKAGFDFEDYHRAENVEATRHEIERIVYLENKYVPQLDYVSASSPLIARKIVEHFPLQQNIITLLNCFPLTQQPVFKKKQMDDTSLQLFWFSQTIGANRGLEVVIDAMIGLNDPDIHFTLAGRSNEDMVAYIKSHAGTMLSNIHFAGIIQPEHLPEFASQFDVGIALEMATPVNRDVCLTNKIFTYLLAGNAVILSETAMQLAFNLKYKVGESVGVNDVNDLSQKIRLYKEHIKLNDQKLYNYQLAKRQLNWEVEFEKLKSVIKKQ